MTTDYHDFVTIDAHPEERRFLRVGDLWENAATCHGCDEYIRSKNRHDYVTCKCGRVSVDGGSWYAKRSAADRAGFTNHITPFNRIEEEKA